MSKLKLAKKLDNPIQPRSINTARDKLRTRNRLRQVNTALHEEDRKHRLNRAMQTLKTEKSLKSLEAARTSTKASTRVDFGLFKMVQKNLKSSHPESDPNYCPNHPHNPIEYICCDEQIGI